MLNPKTKQRELAYVTIIQEIKPIPGYDRVEHARTNGWWCVVKKDAFKVGDLCIYFEIDSKLPETEKFEFCRKYNFRVKTQRLCKVLSQGLIMTPAELGLENIKEGDYLTEKLGVTYYEPEDNMRKADNKKLAELKADKFMEKWIKKHKFLAKIKFICNWRRKTFLKKYFAKQKKTGDWPFWVMKTDEERCLPGKIKVLTENGYIPISKIVNQKLDIKVASINKEGKIEYKKILDYQKFNNNSEVMTIKYPIEPEVQERTTSIVCTPDHKIYTNRGYIEAKDLTLDDYVYSLTECYNNDALEAIYGMLLGDSHIYDDKRSNGKLRIVATNGEKQLEYLKYKQQIFNGDGKIFNAGVGSFGKLPSYHWFLNVDANISLNVRKDWYQTGKKKITNKVINKLTPVSLAFWFMDDGSLTFRNIDKTAYFIRLNTQSFSYDEIEKLRLFLLNQYNIISKINKDIISSKGEQLFRLDISSTEESNKFLNLIAPYICDSMLYKLPPIYQDRVIIPLSYKKEKQVLPVQIHSIDIGQKKNISWPKTFNTVYDLEIEDNHNFISENIVVHNCQNLPALFINNDKRYWVTEKVDGTSTTFTMAQASAKKRHAIICSRNVVFNTPEKEDKNYYKDTDGNVYVEMFEKYDINKVLNYILNKHPDYEFITIQGETYGGTIQKRKYCDDHRFAIFNYIYKKKGEAPVRLNPSEMLEIITNLNDELGTELMTVPILNQISLKDYDNCDKLLLYAEGKSVIDGLPREGLVFRSLDGKDSFKAVSNSFLEKYHS